MTNLVRFPHPNSPLILTEEESEALKWEPFACALYEEINDLKVAYDAPDEIMVRVLRVLLEGWEYDLKHENGDGDDGAA